MSFSIVHTTSDRFLKNTVLGEFVLYEIKKETATCKFPRSNKTQFTSYMINSCGRFNNNLSILPEPVYKLLRLSV